MMSPHNLGSNRFFSDKHTVEVEGTEPVFMIVWLHR